MPINAGFEFQRLEDDLAHADSISEKVRILQKMLQVGPKHKSAEKLRNGIKKRIVKYKSMLQKEKQASKGSGGSISIKKEGSAQVVLIGVTNVGKSTLLAKLTNAKPLIADYEFTTVLPEVGTLNYNGVIIQTIEVPAITENFLDKELGPSFLSIARHADLIVIVSKKREDAKIIKNELIEAAIPFKGIIVKSTDDLEKVRKKIWSKLGLIYVFTKTPGKKKDYPPVALKKGSTVKDLAEVVHKDFIKKFKFAKIWGVSAKFDAQTVGLTHVLKEEDIVEVHIK